MLCLNALKGRNKNAIASLFRKYIVEIEVLHQSLFLHFPVKNPSVLLWCVSLLW